MVKQEEKEKTHNMKGGKKTKPWQWSPWTWHGKERWGFRVDIMHNRTHWKEAGSWMGAYGACVKAQIQLSTNKLHFSSHHSQ
jgi:hypothetical protein